MTIKLENIVDVPHSYTKICVNEKSIIGFIASSVGAYTNEYSLYKGHILNHDGFLIKQFANDYYNRNVLSKFTYFDFRVLSSLFSSPGDFDLTGALAFLLFSIPQAFYGVMTYPLKKRDVKNFSKTFDCVCDPVDIACTKDKICILQSGEFPLKDKNSETFVRTVDIRIFDMLGNPVKKILSEGETEDKLILGRNSDLDTICIKSNCIGANQNSLYVLDTPVDEEEQRKIFPEKGIRIREFDFDGVFKRIVFQANKNFPYYIEHRNSIFTVTDNAMYFPLTAKKQNLQDHRTNNSIGKLDLAGNLKAYDCDLNAPLLGIRGIAANDSHVFLLTSEYRDGPKISTLNANTLQIISEDDVPELSRKKFAENIEYFNEKLYIPLINKKIAVLSIKEE